MERISDVTGVVLAGGASRRMGRDKAWLSLRGSPLVAHQAMILSTVFDDVRVAAKSAAKFEELGLTVVVEPEADFATIYGLRAALKAADRPVFALAVDMPRIPPPLVSAVAARLRAADVDAVVPKAAGRLQGVCAGYRPSILPLIESQIAAKRLALQDLLARARTEIWEEKEWAPYAQAVDFQGLNTQEDFETVAIR